MMDIRYRGYVIEAAAFALYDFIFYLEGEYALQSYGNNLAECVLKIDALVDGEEM
jgi:hypothetical protein